MPFWQKHATRGLQPLAPATRSGVAVAAWLALAVLASAAALPTPASAQVDPSDPTVQIAGEREAVDDPPGRAGRLADTQGSAWLFHPEAGEWMAAQRNRPLTTGDRLATDADGRLALQIGSSSLLVDGDTELEILRLDDESIEVQLLGGSVALRLRNSEAAREWSVVTPEGRFRPLGVGRLRIDRSADLSQLTVWEGQGQYEGTQSALTVSQGQRADFWLDANRRAQYSLGAPRLDGFESWVAEFDRANATRQASRYVSPEMTGADELDRHGRWEQDPEYGAIWQPNAVPVDWAPYAAGHWAWVAPWGWSWVDDAPWGFAPFHYGRWVHVRNRWSWAPGRYVARPVYAPALVGWLGGGVSVTIGSRPAVGWFPLAPREAYVPYRRVSPRYVRVVNGPHFRHGGDIERLIQSPRTVLRGVEYRNRKFHHGTTAVPVQAFEQRGRVNPVRPEWRGGAMAREFDRLPASPVGAIGRPEGVRPGPAPGWRPPGDRRDAGRDGPRDGWRPDGVDARAGAGPDLRPDPREGRDGRWVREGRGGSDGRPYGDDRPGRDPREPRGGQPPLPPTGGPAVTMPVMPAAPVMPVSPPVMAQPPGRALEPMRDWANGRNRPERLERGAAQGVEPAMQRPHRPPPSERQIERMAAPPAAMPQAPQMPMAAPRPMAPERPIGRPQQIAPPPPPEPQAAPRPVNPREAFEQRRPGGETGRERPQRF